MEDYLQEYFTYYLTKNYLRSKTLVKEYWNSS